MPRYKFEIEAGQSSQNTNRLFIYNEGGYLVDSHRGTRSDLVKKINKFLEEHMADIDVGKSYSTYMLPQYVKRYLGSNSITMTKLAGDRFKFTGDTTSSARKSLVVNTNGTAAHARRELCATVRKLQKKGQ